MVDVTVGITGLGRGTRYAIITVEAPGAIDAPKMVTVKVIIKPSEW